MTKLGKPKFFPPPELAEAEGIVLFGGKLSEAWLLDAYTHGIFPWPIFHETDIVVWWSPDPRAVIELDSITMTRRLRRTCLSDRFEVTCDRDFGGVIRGCATTGARAWNTWLTDEMIEAYEQLHAAGYAHSVEAWYEGQLAGGVYGVALGAMFAGESMFYHERDASKVSLMFLLDHLRARGYTLFDIQQLTPHTARLGATEIPRAEYLQRLAEAVARPITFGAQLEGELIAARRGARR
jgi:leucyl/phenylalanyl-tRNA--protein transferase